VRQRGHLPGVGKTLQDAYNNAMSHLYLRAVRSALIGYIWFFAVIFIPAWTLNYWQGWTFFLTTSIVTTLVTIYIALNDQQLLESRLHLGPTAEKTTTQKIITSIAGPVFTAAIVVMVFDHRFGWSPAVPTALVLLGDVLAVAGIGVYFFVVRENRYAAATIDLTQGQTVVDTGPYAIVRHPMYSGALLFFIALPLALGSWWGLLFMPLFVAGFAWRLLNEEKFLREHLPGYTDYMRKVRYRLAPYIW
jgi:protein-S-isoprenylcysteine O-methyltransferase Ste14